MADSGQTMSLQYTVGDWTVTSDVPAASSTKQITLDNMDFSTNYGNPCGDCNDVRMINVAGSGLVSNESIRYARTLLSDVYSSATDIPAVARATAKSGVRTLCELKLNLTATNSKTGVALQFPLKGWVCLQAPTASLITSEAFQYLLTRTLSICFGQGKTDASLVMNVARGDLNPN